MRGEYVKLVEELNKGPLFPFAILNKKKLDEFSMDELIDNTDEERIQRAEKEVKTKPPSVFNVGNGFEKLVFNFKAFPSREKKRHKGYLIHKDGEVHELFCNCADFYKELWDAFVQAGVATYDLSDMFKYDLYAPIQKVPRATPHQDLFVCKHLAALRGYI